MDLITLMTLDVTGIESTKIMESKESIGFGSFQHLWANKSIIKWR